MADWLDLDAPLDQFVRLLDLIRLTPELDWLLLSKRIGNWRKRLQHAREYVALRPGHASDVALLVWIDEWLIDGLAPTNLWLGATVVNQAEADRDIPKLLATPARVRFLSIEPMLGPIHLLDVPNSTGLGEHRAGTTRTRLNALRGMAWDSDGDVMEDVSRLHWVICGGESGPGARPMHPDWARSLRDQCAAAGVPFLFKQHGEWIGVPDLRRLKGGQCPGFGAFDHCQYDRWYEAVRVGKKAAGRQLDGRTHDEFPA